MPDVDAAQSALPIAVSILVALVGVVATLGTLMIKSRSQSNADTLQALTVKDATIAALEKHNELLEEQISEQRAAGEKREAEWRQREAEWREERAEMRERMSGLEKDYRTLLMRITTGGFCEVYEGCTIRVIPGERTSDLKPGGTDD